MLIYVIPLVILIIVLIVVKKRQDANQESGKSPKKVVKNAKNSKTKATKKAVKKQVDEVFEEEELEQSKELPTEARQKIESLIRDRNFFAAEAQINQLLKRDPLLHELYLLLLEIHILQKDEFAINQLTNHVRALGLDDILTQAETRIAATSKKVVETIEFQDEQSLKNKAPKKPEINKSNKAFDELFEQTVPKATTKEAAKAIDFESVITDIPAKIEPVQTEQQPALNFEFTTQKEQPRAIDIDFTKPAEKANLSVEKAPEPVLDFDFTLDQKAAEPTLKVEQPQIEKIQEPVLDLDFAFTEKTEEPKLEVEQPQIEKVQEPVLNLDFAFTEKTEEPTLKVEQPQIEAVAREEIVAVTTQEVDPLILQFPQLQEINEIELNFTLAEKYIELGAYEAAQLLLAEKAKDYSTEHLERVQTLLNKIAS